MGIKINFCRHHMYMVPYRIRPANERGTQSTFRGDIRQQVSSSLVIQRSLLTSWDLVMFPISLLMDKIDIKFGLLRYSSACGRCLVCLRQRWAWGVSWRCCSLLIFFVTRCHPYFLINSHAHHKLVLPQVTWFIKKHAFISAKFTMRVVWSHISAEELRQI